MSVVLNIGVLQQLKIINNDKLIDYPDIDLDVKIDVIIDLIDVLNSLCFQESPDYYIASYTADRGLSKEFRIPTDITVDIIKKHIVSISKYIKNA